MKALDIIELAKQRQQAMRDIRRERRKNHQKTYRKLSESALRHEISCVIEAACRSNTRCPTNEELTDQIHTRAPKVFRTMAREGFFRLEVSAKNWRVAEITNGPCKGMRTKEPQEKTRLYVIIEKR